MIELEDGCEGCALRFSAESLWIAALAELMKLERTCCSFLTLEPVAEADEGSI